MSNQGWAKLNNAPYKRICPGLCPTCQYFRPAPELSEEWHVCEALGKLLSNPHTTPGKCDRYETGAQKLSDDAIQSLHDEALAMKASKQARKQKRGLFA